LLSDLWQFMMKRGRLTHPLLFGIQSGRGTKACRNSRGNTVTNNKTQAPTDEFPTNVILCGRKLIEFSFIGTASTIILALLNRYNPYGKVGKVEGGCGWGEHTHAAEINPLS
jgi:hypothetical protein